MMTLAEFNEQIIRPAVVTGITNGNFDHIIYNTLIEHERGEIWLSDDIVTAMVERAHKIVMEKIPLESPIKIEANVKN